MPGPCGINAFWVLNLESWTFQRTPVASWIPNVTPSGNATRASVAAAPATGETGSGSASVRHPSLASRTAWGRAVSWPRFNINTFVPGISISIIKIRRLWDRLIFIMGIPLQSSLQWDKAQKTNLCRTLFNNYNLISVKQNGIHVALQSGINMMVAHGLMPVGHRRTSATIKMT